ncbi:MAG: acyltransferase [Hymenobacter sp.]|nr:MAG: acyltransferase [Hymenobacter sp.]
MVHKRNLLLDYLKGLAIFLVVWGHTMQYAAGPVNVFINPVFIAIYSFHMPLFMAVSGYLFFQSQAKRPLRQLLQAKVKQVLVPLLAWAVIIMVVDNRGVIQHQPRLLPEVLTLTSYSNEVVWTLWFLWASFICSVVAAVVNKKLGDSAWSYLGVIIVVLLLPNAHYFFYIKYMLPYFFAGYLYHKYASRLQLVRQVAVYLSFLGWPLLLLAWQREDYIYFSGPTFSLLDPHSLLIIGYRYLIGAFGVIIFTVLVHKLLVAAPARRVAAWLGTYSLGIYVLGFVINPLLIVRLHAGYGSPMLYSFILTSLIAAAVAGVAGGLTQAISRVPLLNRLLLGGRNAAPAQNPQPALVVPLAEPAG